MLARQPDHRLVGAVGQDRDAVGTDAGEDEADLAFRERLPGDERRDAVAVTGTIQTWMCCRLRSQKTMLASFVRQKRRLQVGEKTLVIFVR